MVVVLVAQPSADIAHLGLASYFSVAFSGAPCVAADESSAAHQSVRRAPNPRATWTDRVTSH
jgi:hypothetical protein